MNEAIVVKVAGQDVVLDPDALEFNEATLGEYMQTEGAKYNYFGSMAVEAQAQLMLVKNKYEEIEAEKFKHYKEVVSGPIPLVESHVKTDPEVVAASKKVVAANRVVELLKSHLRAWDKNHDNAQSFGHMLRKEMDKLGFEIKESGDTDRRVQNLIEGNT
jgi:hypothetical protein